MLLLIFLVAILFLSLYISTCKKTIREGNAEHLPEGDDDYPPNYVHGTATVASSPSRSDIRSAVNELFDTSNNRGTGIQKGWLGEAEGGKSKVVPLSAGLSAWEGSPVGTKGNMTRFKNTTWPATSTGSV